MYARSQVKFDGTPRGLWHLAGPSPDGGTSLRTLCGQILWHDPSSRLTVCTRTQPPGALEHCCAECLRRQHVPLPTQRGAGRRPR